MATEEQDLVHAVWIGDSLSSMEQLTLKLWLLRGLTPWLWTYKGCKNVPPGVVEKDAADIMPRSSTFTFQSEDGFMPGHGKGSYSHWSDQFQLMLLYQFGGWYSQLDVSCLKLSPNLAETYLFPHPKSDRRSGSLIETCVMKIPRGSRFALDALQELQVKINRSTATTIGWLDSLKIISRHVVEHGLEKFIVSEEKAVMASPAFIGGYHWPGPRTEFVHWCNAALGEYARHAIPNSFYSELLCKTNEEFALLASRECPVDRRK